MNQYKNSHVALEGVLELERIGVIPPIQCDRNCATNESFLCGWAKRENGATSLHALESLLEHLNGKQVKVTVEWT